MNLLRSEIFFQILSIGNASRATMWCLSSHLSRERFVDLDVVATRRSPASAPNPATVSSGAGSPGRVAVLQTSCIRKASAKDPTTFLNVHSIPSLQLKELPAITRSRLYDDTFPHRRSSLCSTQTSSSKKVSLNAPSTGQTKGGCGPKPSGGRLRGK